MVQDCKKNHKETKIFLESHKEDSYEALNWTGTFEEYLDVVRCDAKVIRNSFQRMYDMILQWGSESYTDATKEVVQYHFFQDPFQEGKDAIFGLDVPIMKLVNVLKAAALGYGAEKRVILLHGPVGSAKSTICRLIKKGLEVYSRNQQGAIYTFDWVDQDGQLEPIFGEGVRSFKNPMNEEPLLILPEPQRKEFLSTISAPDGWSLKVQGELCPPSQFIFKGLLKHYKGSLEKVLNHVRVRRFTIEEKNRIGIGTFQPKDEKNQDSTELSGDINYRKITQYGSDSDPRAFNFDGEFNIANRGMIEFIEMLKLDVAFLYDLLSASQEHRIKPKKFAQTHIDEVIIGHTNEPEYKKLADNEFMEALRDRTVKIDVPYITKWNDEIKIYARDFNKKNLNGISLAPHSIEMVAMWAVLTRLEVVKKGGLDRMKKLKLYNGEMLVNFTPGAVKEMRKNATKEGLKGISPRYIQDKISNTVVLAQQLGKKCVTPFMLLKELESGLKHHSLISNEEVKKDYINLLDQVKKEYEDIIEHEVMKSFCFEERAIESQCAKYMEQVKLYLENKNCNEQLMRSIEMRIDINEACKNDFRQEIANYMESCLKQGKTFDYRANAPLQRALEAEVFANQKATLKMVFSGSPSEGNEIKEKIEVATTNLIKNFGYDEISATLVLEYVSDSFARKTDSLADKKVS